MIAHYKYKGPNYIQCTTCSDQSLVNNEFFNGLYSFIMPAFLLALICSNLKYEYDQDYLLNQLNCKGVLRLLIFIVCWLPIIVLFPLKSVVKEVSYGVFIMCGILYIIACMTSAILLFIVAPLLFHKLGLEVRGDLCVDIKKEKPKKKEPENLEQKENKHDDGSWDIGSKHDNHDDLAKDKIQRYSNFVSNNKYDSQNENGKNTGEKE